MRVVIATPAERTHFLNLVPLAWALRAAGHEVLVASQPELAPSVATAGLPFAPVGRDHDLRALTRRMYSLPGAGEAVDWDDERTWRMPWGVLRVHYRQVVAFWWKAMNELLVDDLVGLCRTWRPDLVVWEPTTFAGAVAARACGAAHVRFLWSLDLFARMRGLFLERMREQPAASREDPLEEWLTGLAGRYGVDFDEELVFGQLTVDQVPPELRLEVGGEVEYAGMRFVPYNGRAVVPAWLREPPERPRLCLTLGTSSAAWYGGHSSMTGAVVEALADVDAEVVATVPADRRRGLESPPPNVRLVDYVPLHALAAASTATINHGGPGSVLTSMAYGLPQALMADPRLFDTPLLARRVAGAGAGVALGAEQADPQALRGEALRVLGDPDLRRHAARLREAMLAQPAPAAMVARLERHAAERRTA
ncbi:activator-dependent family glycosyltransferase [Nocardiopsis sp. ATB16-24]|uniref:activator-dependent family glycosyltransferase n=1 Tax=Nocardiopsis sp. ATB16-24 TaxID=3019555 RepID=UPI00255358AE|nr:activator-dependent family glycosyltransferase [Nocardiopsis sp. ATB16-24]